MRTLLKISKVIQIKVWCNLLNNYHGTTSAKYFFKYFFKYFNNMNCRVSNAWAVSVRN